MSVEAQLQQLIVDLRDIQAKLNKAPGDLARGMSTALDIAGWMQFPDWWIADRRRDAAHAVNEMKKARDWSNTWCDTQCNIIQNCFSLRDAEAAYRAVSVADQRAFFVTKEIVGTGWESDSRQLYEARLDTVPTHLTVMETALQSLADAFGHLAKAVEDRNLALIVSLVGFMISLVGWIVSVAGLGSPAAPIAIAGVILSTLGLVASIWGVATLPDPTSEATVQSDNLAKRTSAIQSSPWPKAPAFSSW